MRPTISAIAKSTKDYPRPCKGSQLMGSQEFPANDDWPRMKGWPPRLSGLKGCATGRRDADTGEHVRESGPEQTYQANVQEGLELLREADALQDSIDSVS